MPEYSEASSTVRFIFFQIGTLDILDLSCLSDIRCNLLAFGDYIILKSLRYANYANRLIADLTFSLNRVLPFDKLVKDFPFNHSSATNPKNKRTILTFRHFIKLSHSNTGISCRLLNRQVWFTPKRNVVTLLLFTAI